MNFLRRLTLTIHFLVVYLVCSYFILLASGFISGETLTQAIYFIQDDFFIRSAFICIFVFLLLFNYLFFCLNRNVVRPAPRVIEFTNPNGKATIKVRSLEAKVQQIVSEFPEVGHSQSKIDFLGKKLRLNLDLTFLSDVNVPEVTARIQALVKEKLSDTIGESYPLLIDVNITEMKLNKKDEIQSAASTQDAGDTNLPFQGYRP